MTALLVKTRGPSRLWRTSGPSPGLTIPVEGGDGNSEGSHATLEQLGTATRARRLLGTTVRYVGHPSFDDPSARDAILAPVPDRHVAERPRRSAANAELPPYLASLRHEGPLLTREQEIHLFRKMNYLKYRAHRLRDRIDPVRASAVELDEVERLLDEALAIRTRIIRANLRLVVALAKRHPGTHDDLFERVSDGNLAMVRAVDRFDYARGNKFSTYASWAIINVLRSRERDKRQHARFLTGHEETLLQTADTRPQVHDHEKADTERGSQVHCLLGRLDDRERRILVNRYGIGGANKMTLRQIGEELGISKERVRQIETRAQRKLGELGQKAGLDLSLS